ncbi:hypothetical protein [Streptomyces sp. SP17KL33]|uniref:hypothetical protein n=1 Tax=Streptomyces sp. SP17KL33 TaxID=3002534 RepID=UPI002E7A4D87|nr:hypothetical protein [Streptomyces sp. SP17KL33]MEE1831782.1 hypothetical protein [Streptomyces sp. SP17KL33]
MTGEGWQAAWAWPIGAFTREPQDGSSIGRLAPGTGGTSTDLHELLDSYPDVPPLRQRGDVNLVGPLSSADDLARSLAALKIRVQPHDSKTSLVSPEEAREHEVKEVDRLLGTSVYFQRHAHAAMLERCVLGADSKEDCSTRSRSRAGRSQPTPDRTARRALRPLLKGEVLANCHELHLPIAVGPEPSEL